MIYEWKRHRSSGSYYLWGRIYIDTGDEIQEDDDYQFKCGVIKHGIESIEGSEIGDDRTTDDVVTAKETKPKNKEDLTTGIIKIFLVLQIAIQLSNRKKSVSSMSSKEDLTTGIIKIFLVLQIAIQLSNKKESVSSMNSKEDLTTGIIKIFLVMQIAIQLSNAAIKIKRPTKRISGS